MNRWMLVTVMTAVCMTVQVKGEVPVKSIYDGAVLGYFGSRVAPESDALVGAIEAALGTPQEED